MAHVCHFTGDSASCVTWQVCIVTSEATFCVMCFCTCSDSTIMYYAYTFVILQLCRRFALLSVVQCSPRLRCQVRLHRKHGHIFMERFPGGGGRDCEHPVVISRAFRRSCGHPEPRNIRRSARVLQDSILRAQRRNSLGSRDSQRQGQVLCGSHGTQL